MFGCSEHEWSSCITNILGPSVMHMARCMTFFVLQLKDCVDSGGVIGNLCLRVVLSAKHLVRSIGLMVYALQHFLIPKLIIQIQHCMYHAR